MLDWIEIGRYLEDQISSAVQRIPPDHPEIGNEHNFKAQGWIHFKVCKLQTISLKGRFPRSLGVYCSNCGWFFCSIIEFWFCCKICGGNQNQDFMKGQFYKFAVLQIPGFLFPQLKSDNSAKHWGVQPNWIEWCHFIRTPRTNLVWKTFSSLALQNFCRNKVCFCRNKMCFSQKLWNSREMVLVAHAEQHKKTWRKYSEFFDQKVSYLYIFLSFIRKRTFK